MKIFSELHDGSIDGVLLDAGSTFLFLSATNKNRFVLKIDDVLALKMTDFREGNILFDVVVREGEEIVEQDVEELFGFDNKSKVIEKLTEAHQEEFVVVEVNPSYGATLFALGKNAKMMPHQAWLNELFTTASLPGN